MTADRAGKRLKRAKELAKVNVPGLGFHGLRRAVATDLAEAGLSPDAMSQALAWPDESMALRYQQAEKKVDEVLRERSERYQV